MLQTQSGLRVHHRRRDQAVGAADARRGARTRSRRRHPRQGRRGGAAKGGDDGAGGEGELRRGGQGGGRRSEVDRAHHPRRGAPGSRREQESTTPCSLKAGETTAPIATDNAVVVARVKERQDVTPEDMANREGRMRTRAHAAARRRVLLGLHAQGAREDDDDVQRDGAQDGLRTIARHRHRSSE